MEELHRIHKDVPFGYWVFWVEPALRRLAQRTPKRRPLPKPTTTIAC